MVVNNSKIRLCIIKFINFGKNSILLEMGAQAGKCFKKEQFQKGTVIRQKSLGYDIRNIPFPVQNKKDREKLKPLHAQTQQQTQVQNAQQSSQCQIKQMQNLKRQMSKKIYIGQLKPGSLQQEKQDNTNKKPCIIDEEYKNSGIKLHESLLNSLRDRVSKMFDNLKPQLNRTQKTLDIMSQSHHLVEKEVLNSIIGQFNSYYLKEQDIVSLLLTLQKYAETCRAGKSQEQADTVIHIVGKQLSMLLDQAFFKHIKILNIAQILLNRSRPQRMNLNKLNYDIDDIQQVSKVASEVKNACEQDLDAFFFLTDYLARCLQKMNTNGKSTREMQAKLGNVLDILRKKHPPNQKKPYISQIKPIQFPKSVINNRSIDLSKIKPKQRVQYLDNFIIQISQDAKNGFQQLINITKDPCNNNNGSHYKTGLKIKNSSNVNSINRVKQKLFSSCFEKYQIVNQTDLFDFISNERVYYEAKMNQKLQKIQKQIQFTVSDMIRGKCQFGKISEIYAAAEQIISNCRANNLKIQEIDNRLASKTADLVFKIQINDVIAEFQLAYQFDITANEFNHKLYELARSNFFTLLSTLFNYLQKSDQFFSDFQHILDQNKRRQTEIRIKPIGGDLQSIQNLHSQYKTFLSTRKYKTNKNAGQDNKTYNYLVQRHIFNLEKIIKQIGNQKVQQNYRMPQILFYRTALFLSKLSNRNNQAKSVALQCQNLSISKNDFKTKTKSLYLLRDIYQASGRLQQQLKTNLQILQMDTANFGVNSTQYARTLQKIAITYFKKQKYNQAIQYYKRSIQIQTAKKDDQLLSDGLKDLGLCYSKKRKFDQALGCIMRSYDIKKRIFGDASKQVGIILSNIGNMYDFKGEYQQALKYYKKSLQVFEKVFGQNSIQCALNLNNIGSILSQEAGNQKMAIKYLQRALQIKRRVKGRNNPDCSSTLDNIGRIYTQLGQFDEALMNHQEAYSIQVLNKGQNSLGAAFVLNYIAYNYYMKGYYDQSLKKYGQIIRIRKSNNAQNTYEQAEIYYMMSLCFYNNNCYQDALSCLSQSIKIKKQLFGQQARVIVDDLFNAGLCHFRLSDFHRALRCYNQALSIIQKQQGQKSPLCCFYLLEISKCHYEMLNYTQTLKITSDIVQFYNQKPQQTLKWIKIQQAFFLLGFSYLYIGDMQNCLLYHNKRLQFARLQYKKGSMQQALVLKDIAYSFKQFNHFVQAIENYNKAIQAYKSIKQMQKTDNQNVSLSQSFEDQVKKQIKNINGLINNNK